MIWFPSVMILLFLFPAAVELYYFFLLSYIQFPSKFHFDKDAHVLLCSLLFEGNR